MSHFTKIRMQVVNVLFKIFVVECANAMKILKRRPSVNAKSLFSTGKSYGVQKLTV